MYPMLDRFKFFAAVAVTAALPATKRVHARTNLLGKLQKYKARNADIIVISHPKCGSTWFRVMLSRMYQAHYGLSSRRIVKSDELYHHNRSLPRFLVSNGHYSYERVLQDELKLAKPAKAAGKKLILLARHPCDVVVSWYLQFTKRTKAFKRELINSTLREPIDYENITMWEFVMHDELGLPALIEFHNRWEDRVINRHAGIIVRYEDLRTDPVDVMSKVVSYLDAPFESTEIRDAVAFAAFDNMRKLEKSGYFKNSSMKLRNPKDPDTRKVRRAKVGGFRDYFAEEHVATMESMVRRHLSPSLGYHAELNTHPGGCNPAPEFTAKFSGTSLDSLSDLGVEHYSLTDSSEHFRF